MKHNRMLYGFFAGVGGFFAGGLTLTAVFSKSLCQDLAFKAQDLMQTFLDSELGFNGKIKMDVDFGEPLIPINSNNFSIAIHMNLNEMLIHQLNAMPNLLEVACEGAMWQASIQDMVLLVIFSASIGGLALACTRQKNTKPEVVEENRQELIGHHKV